MKGKITNALAIKIQIKQRLLMMKTKKNAMAGNRTRI